MNNYNLAEFRKKIAHLSNVKISPDISELKGKEFKSSFLIENINAIHYRNSNFEIIETIIFENIGNDIEKSFINLMEISAKNLYFKDCKISSFSIFDSKIENLIFENCEIQLLQIFNCSINSFINKDKGKLSVELSDYYHFDEDVFLINELEINNTTFYKSIEFRNFRIKKVSLAKVIVPDFIMDDFLINDDFLISDSTIDNFVLKDLTRDFKIYSNDGSKVITYNNSLKISNSFFKNDFYLNDLYLGKLELIACRINCSMSWSKIRIDEVNFSNIILEKNFKYLDVVISNLKLLDEETARVFKSFALKNNDQSNFLKYNKLEQNKMLENKEVDDPDYWILQCKRVMSNHGTNWIQAVFVTLCISFVFYLTIYISLKNEIRFCMIFSQEFINGFIRYLNITDYNNPINFKEKSPINDTLALIMMFIGKIFLGIGIYEIITSFRKYHK